MYFLRIGRTTMDDVRDETPRVLTYSYTCRKSLSNSIINFIFEIKVFQCFILNLSPNSRKTQLKGKLMYTYVHMSVCKIWKRCYAIWNAKFTRHIHSKSSDGTTLEQLFGRCARGETVMNIIRYVYEMSDVCIVQLSLIILREKCFSASETIFISRKLQFCSVMFSF